jgi:hypothetical protein
MSELFFDPEAVTELRRQCLHHNVFTMDVAQGMLASHAYNVALQRVVGSVREQLDCMKDRELRDVVASIPSGLRMMIEPVEIPITGEFLRRLAHYCVAVQVQKAYSPVADVVNATPPNSEVIAACPELADQFDDDGLLHLSHDFQLLDGGIRYGDHLLHYHQFLRRGFSSNPNFDFTGTLAHCRSTTAQTNEFRVAIDHRRIMKFSNYAQFIECDTWYGPHFDRDGLDDPNYVGLTVVGRNLPSPFHSSYPLERTEFFWKRNEGDYFKTLEIEELSHKDEPYDNWHINRYVHAQRDMKRQSFCHLDGAAKVYAQNAYAGRLESKMPNNIRPAHYVKLFRIDGALELDPWLSLVSMFFKGNEMVVEYFDPVLFAEKYQPVIDRWQAVVA